MNPSTSFFSSPESMTIEEDKDSGSRPVEPHGSMFRVDLSKCNNLFLYKGQVYRLKESVKENHEDTTTNEVDRTEEVVMNGTSSSGENEGDTTLYKRFNSKDLCLFCLTSLPPSGHSQQVTGPANPGTSFKDPASNLKTFDLLCTKLGVKCGDNESIQEEESGRFDKNKDLPLCSGCKIDYEDFFRLNQKMIEMEAQMNDCVKIMQARIDDSASKTKEVSVQVEKSGQPSFGKSVIEAKSNILEADTAISISARSSQIMPLEPDFCNETSGVVGHGMEKISDGVNEIDLRRGSFHSAREADSAEDTPADPSIGENVDLVTCSPLEQNSKADSYETELEAGSDDDGLSTDSDAGCETWEEILENSRRRTKWLLEMSRQGKLQEHFAKVRQEREVRKQAKWALKWQRNTGKAKPQTPGSTRKHNDPKHKRKCHLCDLELRDTRDLIRHYKEFHPEEKRFTCKYCGKQFKSNQAILSHQRIHTGERPFKCQDCGRCFSQEHSFQRHMITHTEDVHVCKWCGKTFRFLINFGEHNRKHHEGSAECTDLLSDLSEENLKSLGVTAKIHYRFHCHVCMEPIVSQAFLRNHFAKIHPNHSGGHLTCRCGNKFVKYGDVFKHINLGKCGYHGLG